MKQHNVPGYTITGDMIIETLSRNVQRQASVDRRYTRWCAKRMNKAGSSYHVPSHRCSSNETVARSAKSVLAMENVRLCCGFIDYFPFR